MKHPVRDRILILVCALCALCGACACVGLGVGKLTPEPLIKMMERVSLLGIKTRVALFVFAALLALFAILLIAVVLPAKKKRSSSFAIQQNENGMVRISLKALESLVQRCLNQHAELKVVTSSLYSDEESIRVDVHIALQSDISMPLAISALQKQIKRYLEACSGVTVQEVRVFVDGTIPPSEKEEPSAYAIPASLLGLEIEALPSAEEAATDELRDQAQEETEAAEDADDAPELQEDILQEQPAEEEDSEPKDEGEWA